MFKQRRDTNSLPISEISRRLNSLFAFSAIGATEGFVYFRGMADVVLTGRVYHYLIDISEGEYSMCWFLYDETARHQYVCNLGISSHAVGQVQCLLESINPYLYRIHYIFDTVNSEATPFNVELQHHPAGGELAANVNSQNLKCC